MDYLADWLCIKAEMNVRRLQQLRCGVNQKGLALNHLNHFRIGAGRSLQRQGALPLSLHLFILLFFDGIYSSTIRYYHITPKSGDPLEEKIPQTHAKDGYLFFVCLILPNQKKP